MEKKPTIQIKVTDVVRLKNAINDIIWMARRYAHMRCTYAPHMFNDAYDTIRAILNINDRTDSNVVSTWPYAQDGHYQKEYCGDITKKRMYSSLIKKGADPINDSSLAKFELEAIDKRLKELIKKKGNWY